MRDGGAEADHRVLASMTPIVLIGGGGHAKVVAAIVNRTGRYRIIGYTAPTEASAPWGFPYLGGDEVLPGCAASGRAKCAVLAIGIVDLIHDRAAIERRLLANGFALPSIISPDAMSYGDVAVGDGTVVMAGVVLNPGARIGACSIVNTNATVEHDCIVGAYSHVAPGAVLCGGVSVGSRCIIGAQACVLPGCSIADRCIVGAGATVTRDLTEAGVYVGSPARRIRA